MPCEIRRGAKGRAVLLFFFPYLIFRIQKISQKISKFEKDFDKFSDKLLAK
jgi:hypothetical protein